MNRQKCYIAYIRGFIRKLLDAAIKISRGLCFKCPPRGILLVFDTAGSQYLIPYCLVGLDAVVLPTRLERIYLAPRILLRLLANARFIDEFKLRQLYKIYLLSCLQEIKPRVVVTWVDNSIYFQALGRLHPAARFLAVQNGYRSVASLASPSQHPGGWLSENPRWGKTLELQDFFVLGPHTERMYRRFGHRVARFHAVGSLLAGYYKTVVAPGSAPREFDLCLVSEWRASIMDEAATPFPKVRTGLSLLYIALARYAAEAPMRLAIACGSADPQEEEYFRDLFGARAEVVPNDASRFTTYRAMDHSAVSVGLMSTALFEAMSWGRKVFFCNFSGDKTLDCPLPGDWSWSGEAYADFKEKLDNLLRMSAADFESKAQAARLQMASFDPKRPAHIAVREVVIEALGAAG